MFAKLLLVIVVMGAVACALLVNRQQRIESAHRAAVLHEEIARHRQTLWRLRGEVAQRCRPESVRRAVEALGGEWEPLVLEPPTRRPSL